MFRSFALAAILIALAVPLFAADACNLEMTLSCASGNCKTVTKNVGGNACSGDYFFVFLSEDPATKFSNFTNSLGAGPMDCLNSSDFPPGTTTESFVFCSVTRSISLTNSYIATDN